MLSVRRVAAAVCTAALLFGATGCVGDEPPIHANTDKGVKLGMTLKDMKSYEQYQKLEKQFKKYGVEQSPEWLAICNTINRKALRKLGFDPQNDLQKRSGDYALRDACIWELENKNWNVGIWKAPASLEELNNRDLFVHERTVTYNGQVVHVGYVKHKTREQFVDCAVNMQKSSGVYGLELNIADEDYTHEEVCDMLLDLTVDN